MGSAIYQYMVLDMDHGQYDPAWPHGLDCMISKGPSQPKRQKFLSW